MLESAAVTLTLDVNELLLVYYDSRSIHCTPSSLPLPHPSPSPSLKTATDAGICLLKTSEQYVCSADVNGKASAVNFVASAAHSFQPLLFHLTASHTDLHP